MARTFLCLAAAACCCSCLALLLPPPVQARPRPAAGPATDGFGGRRNQPMFPESHFDATEPAEEHRRSPVKPRRPTWSTAAGSVRPELRAVPGGPDPLHHHGGSPSRRPEQERTPSP